LSDGSALGLFVSYLIKRRSGQRIERFSIILALLVVSFDSGIAL